MGKPTGFLEYQRALPAARPPAERAGDWREFHGQLSPGQLREQGARCMNCGVPFCHSGTIIQGATSGCPLNNLIPEWNELVYRHQWRQALERLHQTNSFPEFTGRVCPAPCESACVLGINDAPVAIKTIEQAIIEKGFTAGWVRPSRPVARTGKRTAVIGSGPAGLACANHLNRRGHTVTVFERDDRPGGLLMYGIPNMKLEKDVVQRRLDLMSEEGVSFVNGVTVGQDYDTQRLIEEFDAIVLCCGAAQPRDLSVAGRRLGGIHFAMEYLRHSTQSLLAGIHADDHLLSAKGKDVLVIGGGDTGTDCVGTALRQGCRSLVQFEIMPQPPPERAADNPWPQWPKIHRVDYGQEEARAIYGADPRAYSVMTKRFIGNNRLDVRAVETVNLEWVAGKQAPREIAGSRREWPAQLVLLALGFLGPETDGLLSQLGITINGRGNVAVNDEKATNVPAVFAAGDIERGQSLVVWAIADGQRAAQGVERFLMRQMKAGQMS